MIRVRINSDTEYYKRWVMQRPLNPCKNSEASCPGLSHSNTCLFSFGPCRVAQCALSKKITLTESMIAQGRYNSISSFI